MNAKEVVEKLEKTPGFIEWRKDNKDAYLISLFTMFEELKDGEWMANYYDKKTEQATVFVFHKNGFEEQPKSEVFKKGAVKKLDMNKVKVDFDKALVAGAKVRDQCCGERILKIIAILQNLKEGLVWNLTYLTSAYRTLNVRISAVDGKEITHKVNSIFEFKE
ncbi:MAG: hypothetical protein GY861_27760 [bacterium]|nr:hypothetical protein [bacterium]